MRLYHATSAANCERIKREGFARSYVMDSQGCSWFWFERQDPTGWAGSTDAECLVIVDMPVEKAEPYIIRFDGKPYGCRVPFDIVNTYQPFRYEPI
jgi:hypothetical protein